MPSELSKRTESPQYNTLTIKLNVKTRLFDAIMLKENTNIRTSVKRSVCCKGATVSLIRFCFDLFLLYFLSIGLVQI